MKENYHIIPFRMAPSGDIAIYIEKLHATGRLADRLSDLLDPTPNDMLDMLAAKGQMSYFVYDTNRNSVVTEFTFSDIIGGTGLIHFSMSPDVVGHEVLYIMRATTDDVLLNWQDYAQTRPFLEAIIGLTPTPNHRACVAIQRVGFKKIAEVPFICKYKGDICPGLFTIKRRDTLTAKKGGSDV